MAKVQSSLNELGDCKVMVKSDYDKVIFHDVAESYATDADVDCRFSFTSGINPTPGDQIALYKIGWVATHQYVACKSVAFPIEDERYFEISILFKAQYLPKDDGEFYQFCYITTDGCVKGASTPFRFRRPADEDLVEVEDNDNDLMIIRTRTAVIEEKLRDVVLKNLELMKERNVLENKITEKENCRDELEKKLKRKDDEVAKLHQEVMLLTARKEEEKNELVKQLHEMSSVAKKQDSDTKTTLMQNEAYICELRNTVKVLSEQKEELSKKLANEAKEINSLKETESRLKAFTHKNGQLTKELILQRESSCRLQQQIKTLETSLKDEQKNVAETKEKLAAAEVETKQVLAQLLDTEHMLIAMEKSKHLATEELMTHAKFKETMTAELEKKRKEYESLKSEYDNLKKDHEQTLAEYSKLKSEHVDLSNKCNFLTDSNLKFVENEQAHVTNENMLRVKILDLNTRLINNAIEEESRKELEKVYLEYDHLKSKVDGVQKEFEREQFEHMALKSEYSILSKRFEILAESNKKLVKNEEMWKDTEKSLQSAINDLTGRLRVGAAEYRNKYLQGLKLEKKLHKLSQKYKTQMQQKENGSVKDKESTVSERSSPETTSNLEEKLELQNLPESDLKTSKNAQLTQQLEQKSPDVNKNENAASTPKQDGSTATKTFDVTDKLKGKSIFDIKPFNYTGFTRLTQSPNSAFYRPQPGTGRCSEESNGILQNAATNFQKILPPPIQPEITEKARQAAMTAINRQLQEGSLEFDGLKERCENPVSAILSNVASVPQGDEGEETTKCPVCGLVFYAPFHVSDMEKHIENHFSFECPVCQRAYEERELFEFEVHVQAHFEEQNLD